MIDCELMRFLEDLAKNNNRDWFALHKDNFKTQEEKAKLFFKKAQNELSKSDLLDGHHLMRIYRDVRFSKDKTPYKARFSGSFSRASAKRRGSYYINIEPGNSFVGGGFYGPNTDDLKRIRQEFEMDASEMRTILAQPTFKITYGNLQGKELKSAPRGFDPTHEAIDLIRKKQFYVAHHFSDEEVMSPDFVEKACKALSLLLPYFDYMSSVLTTNSNGESIL